MTNEEAVKWLENLKDDLRETRVSHLWHYDQTLDEIIAILCNQHEWIPCKERLPDTSSRYLVTRGLPAAGNVWNRGYIVNYSDLMGLSKEKIWYVGNVGKSDFEKINDVVAWMPLPPAYKGGKSND